MAEIDPARFDVGAPVRVRALARFPAVERDLSVLVDAVRALGGRPGRDPAGRRPAAA